MKKLISILMMLCVLLPACALAEEVTVVDRSDDSAEQPNEAYVLNTDGSLYTMTISGVHGNQVDGVVTGDVTLVLDGVQVKSGDPYAMRVWSIAEEGTTSLTLKLKGKSSLSSTMAFFYDEEDGCKVGGVVLYADAPLTITGDGGRGGAAAAQARQGVR